MNHSSFIFDKLKSSNKYGDDFMKYGRSQDELDWLEKGDFFIVKNVL